MTLQLRQLVRLHPDAHRILPGAEDLNARYSGYARQFVDEIDVGVVRQERAVVGALGRIEIDEHQRRVLRFLYGHAGGVHLGG